MSDTEQRSHRDHPGFQAILLGGFTALATALLLFGNLATKDAIAERLAEDLRASLNQVVPVTLYDNNLLEQPLTLPSGDQESVTIYRATLQGDVTALAWEVVGYGYSGAIRLILGIDAEGKILGVRVLAHAETPGLGDKIELAKDDWILGFDGLQRSSLTPKQWGVKKDGGEFDQFSGATITPRAVVKAVKGGLDFFMQHRDALLSLPVKVVQTASRQPPTE